MVEGIRHVPVSRARDCSAVCPYVLIFSSLYRTGFWNPCFEFTYTLLASKSVAETDCADVTRHFHSDHLEPTSPRGDRQRYHVVCLGILS